MKRFSKFSLRFLVLAVAGIVVFPHPIPVNADETAARTYRVKAGDTIAKIAADLAISPNDIIDTNNLREQGGIYVGEELKLPANTFDMTPTAHAGEDANWFFDRLRGHFDSLEEFDKIAQKAKETGVCEQAISELRLRYCIRGPEISALRETLSNFEKSLPNWKVADSVIFNNWISLDGFLHLAHGVIDQAEGDTMGYEREMKQAFWINPKDAERFGKVLVDGHARRGLILDINQKTLADNASVRTVVVDNYELNHLDEAEAALAGPLGLDTKDLDTKFGWDRKYIVIKKHVPEATAKEIEEQLKAHSVGGVTFEQETERIYPNGAVACHVVGFVNSDYEGVQGIERTEDQYLRGHDGFRLPNNHRVEPQDGCNVRLTLDLN
jgi:hypothetical protein